MKFPGPGTIFGADWNSRDRRFFSAFSPPPLLAEMNRLILVKVAAQQRIA